MLRLKIFNFEYFIFFFLFTEVYAADSNEKVNSDLFHHQYWPDLTSSLYYYKEETIDQTDTDPDSGILWNHWITSENGDQGDWAMHPPYLTRLSIPPGVQTTDQWESFWLPADVYFVVIEGTLKFGNVENKQLEYGDIYWAIAGELIGPLINISENSTCVVVIMSTSPIIPRSPSEVPSDNNPSVDQNLLRSRTYRQYGDGFTWEANPVPQEKECINNGAVQQMYFETQINSPSVFRVKWAANCSIPYHYHPQGAMYFVLYGNMWFDGDGPVPSVQFNKAEMRYTAPGYPYGPEYNSDFDPLEIIVLGVETPPTFEEPPKPYKFQKPVTVTHIFDEL